MKILFVARHFTYFRNFDSVIRLLASRGHAVHLAAERDESLGGLALVEQLAREYPHVTFGDAPGREADEWTTVVGKVRLAVDYLRYLDPAYDPMPRLRSRAAERAPRFVVGFGESGWSRAPFARRVLRGVLRGAERALPLSRRIDEFLRERQPDVMLITPLLGVEDSAQPDYVRAAQARGIPTALCVWSWDHLSSKALIRDMPDRVFVWNPVQRDEATRLHGVPDERIVVTGAQCFDQWFDRRPSRSREEFCARVGLPVDRPIVLYVASALFRGSPSEAAFAESWVAQLRGSSNPLLRDASILIRPHPQRAKEWDAFDAARFPHVAVWGGNPVTTEARADYFDSLFYSAAVVGLNTSAFLEAAIAGRPVFAILPEAFRDNQEGTIHFHYLTAVGGGLLHVSRSLEAHAEQLREALSATVAVRHNVRFVEAFLRPSGLGTAATPQFADAVEQLGTAGAAASSPSPSPLGRLALHVLVRLAASERGGAWLMDDEERRSIEWHAAKTEARLTQQRARVDEQQRKQAGRQDREARKRERIDAWRREKRDLR